MSVLLVGDMRKMPSLLVVPADIAAGEGGLEEDLTVAVDAPAGRVLEVEGWC
jgi:hypothetical protein